MVLRRHVAYVESGVFEGVTTLTSIFKAEEPGTVSGLVMEGWVSRSGGEDLTANVAIVIVRENQLQPGLLATPGVDPLQVQEFFRPSRNLWTWQTSRTDQTGGGGSINFTLNSSGVFFTLQCLDEVYLATNGSENGTVGGTVEFTMDS